MLSTSTLTSSTTSNYGHSTPISTTAHYSMEFDMESDQHPLTDLIEAETTYLRTLKVIDSKIAPLWMKQTTQTAPDFTELMKHASDIFMVNKRFGQKLTKLVGNAQAPQELGNLLMHWVNDMQVPYTNYSRCYIPNLNQRYDILANESLDDLMKNLSKSASHVITLETFFNAPIQQLKYYHGLYNRLLNSVEPNRPDFEHFAEATRCLGKILTISHKSSATISATSVLPPPISAYVDHSSNAHKAPKKKNSITQQDDFFSYYLGAGEDSPLESSNNDARLDGFGSSLILDEYDHKGNGGSVQPDATGTAADELSNIQPRTIKILDTVPAKNDNSTQVHLTFIQPETSKIHKVNDGLENDNTPPEKDDSKPISTRAPTLPAGEIITPAKPTQIETPSPTPVQISGTPTPYSTIDTISPVLAAPSSQKTLSPATGDSPRPISPRAVQVQQAVTPVAAMQAVSQKTDDYFSNTTTSNPGSPRTAHKNQPAVAVANLPKRSTSSTPGATVLPRTSSIKETTQSTQPSEALYRQSPIMVRSNLPGSPQFQPAHKPLPMMNNVYNQASGSTSPVIQHAPLLRTSSHNSTTQQLYGASPHPPRTHSNSQPGTPTPVYQQHSPILGHQSMGMRSPVQSSPTAYQHTTSPTDDPQNDVRQVLYSNNRCEVFHWKDQSWYAVEGQCTLQVRLTFGGRSCLAIQTSGQQVYLNAWIVPSMTISQPSATDISISVAMKHQENYLVHFGHGADASNFLAMLHRVHHESSSPPTPAASPRRRPEPPAAVELRDETPSVEDVPQTLKPIFQCKAKLFVQSETSKWNPMGTIGMRLSQQLPSQKTHVYIEGDKTAVISSIVRSGNVERLTTRRISFLLPIDKSSIVYLVQLKDDQTGNKVFDYLKTQNAAHGW